jgi:GNAT superfamily N-acetyltransferase
MKNLQIQKNENFVWNEKIKLYKDIFWESPWEEWFICTNCEQIFPKKFMWKCDCWNSILEPFYKNLELKQTFEELSKKTWYNELIAEILEEKVWFFWWWNSSLEKINEDKLWLENEKFKILEKNILENFPNFNKNNFYYLAEIWVKKEYRWQDIAWRLYKENLKKLKENNEKFILVRTTKKSDVPYKWFLKEWYKEVFQYNDEQDRVILVFKI